MIFSKSKEAEKKDAPKEETREPEEKEPVGEENTEGTSEEEQDIASEKKQAEKEKSAPKEDKKKEEKPSDKAQLAIMTDRYTRLLADFDNFRKRQLREHEEQVKRANEHLLEDLLPVIDNLEIALSKAKDPEDPTVTGIQMVHTQLMTTLEKYAMKPIDAKGKPFDPMLHEALTQMASDTVPEQTVIDQFRRGWTLGGRLLRPAQVIVSSGKATPAPEEKKADEPEEEKKA